MKNILAVYYTQTGQLRDIIQNLLLPIEKMEDCSVDYLEISTEVDYPFPWKGDFFKPFPEIVLGVPQKLRPIKLDLKKDYDLIIIGNQPWYLSPNLPIWSFLNSEMAGSLLKNKPVITVHGARNMWVRSQETIKSKLIELGANLVGNIVLQDRHDNIISGITIIKWLIHGNKGPFTILPKAGVSETDIENTGKYGEIIYNALSENQLNKLQDKLINANALRVKYHLAKIEFTAHKIFTKFAGAALKAGKANLRKRESLIKVINWYIVFALFVLSPIASLVFQVARILLFPIANKKIAYYYSTRYNDY